MNKRNQRCHCGSGAKFKKCCGNEARLCEKRRAEHEADMENMRAGIARRQAEEREKRAQGIPTRRPMMAMHTIAIAALACGAFEAGPFIYRKR